VGEVVLKPAQITEAVLAAIGEAIGRKLDRFSLYAGEGTWMELSVLIDGESLLEVTLRVSDEPAQNPTTFQARVWPWLVAAFDADKGFDLQERAHRFLEEGLELAQAAGCSQEDAHRLVGYVFGRPAGTVAGEIGDVMNVLAALAFAHGEDMHSAADAKLAEINTPEKIARVRAKRAARPAGSPLPGWSEPAAVAQDKAGARD